MNKIFISTLFIILLMSNLISDENLTIELNTSIEDSNLSDLSEDELLAEFMKLDEKSEELKERKKVAIAKTELMKEKSKNISKLRKTVDELAEKLGVN